MDCCFVDETRYGGGDNSHSHPTAMHFQYCRIELLYKTQILLMKRTLLFVRFTVNSQELSCCDFIAFFLNFYKVKIKKYKSKHQCFIPLKNINIKKKNKK